MLFEDAGAFFESSTSRRHIIDEPNTLSSENFFLVLGDGESISEIGDAFFTRIRFHLRSCVAGTDEDIGENWNRESGGNCACEFLGQELGLIEPTET